METRPYPTRSELGELAGNVREIIWRHFSAGRMERSWKPDLTPVTAADMEVHDLVTTWFLTRYPHISIITEEGCATSNDSEYFAICDPVDGTIPFCSGIPVATFCLAIIHKGRPVISAIHDPFVGRMWTAEQGKGTCCNGSPVRVLPVSDITKSIISVSWWDNNPYMIGKVYEEIRRTGARWMNLAAAGICGGLIASGDLSASIFPGSYSWETAAMDLIVTEAGGIATDLCGNSLKYGVGMEINGHVMSACPELQQQLLEAMRNARRLS